MKYHSNKFLFAFLASTGLVACAGPAPTIIDFTDGEDVFVVAEGEIVGEAAAYDENMIASDCEGGGLGVRVTNIQGDENYLYDKTGRPCERSEVMFDGATKAGKRSPDPTSANITFTDQIDYTSIPEAPLPSITVVDTPGGALPENAALEGVYAQVEPEDKVVMEGFERTINKWQQDHEHAGLVKDAEVLLAGVRGLDRLNRNEVLKKHQEYIMELESQLRSVEKENTRLKDHGSRLVLDLNQKTNVALMDEHDRRTREKSLQKELSIMEQKARTIEQANLRMREKFGEDVVVYRERIDDLSSQLREAEHQADSSRQTMVMEAAKKIAEAEYLAQEAQLAKRLTMQRRAQRLQLEAGDLLGQAQKMGDGQPIVLPKFSGLEKMPSFEVVARYRKKGDDVDTVVPYPEINEIEGGANQRLNIETVTLHLNEKNKALSEIFEVAFDDMADRIGLWQVVWQLKPENEKLKHQEWTVIAETPLNQFLAYVSEKLDKDKDVKLKFQRFDQSRVFMITD